MSCFKCELSFNCSNLLVKHIRKNHFSFDQQFKCAEENCNRYFFSASSFKRHLAKIHQISRSSENFSEYICVSDSADSVTQVFNCTEILPEKTFDSSDFIEYSTNSEKTDITFNDDMLLKNSFKDSILKFLLNMHNNNNFSRKDVTEIVSSIVKYILTPISNNLVNFAKNEPINEKSKEFILSISDNIKTIFNDFNTDHKLFTYLNKCSLVNGINQYIINSDIQSNLQRGEPVIDEHHSKGILMPLDFQFKKLFEKTNFFNETIKFMEEIKSQPNIKSIIQMPLWTEKIEMYPEKTLIPYFLYVDDFEINNPLGSNSGKHSVSNFYYSLACFPINESKRENIFLAASIKTEYVKKYEINASIKNLVNSICEIEKNGIEINLERNIVKKIHPIMLLVLGDNLALNCILNFSKSFNNEHWCRLCNVNKSDAQKFHSEELCTFRTIECYDNDLNLKYSLFNEIPSFHVTKNFYVDIMHDLFEGICHYDLCHILLYLINDMKYFSLETLNERMKNFNYGPLGVQNYKTIKREHLLSKKLKMNANEMMNFIYYITLLIGDLVPDDDDVYQFLLNLIEIVETLLCFEITEEMISNLKLKVNKHNYDYIRLFKDTLKPKFHNLVHYAQIIKMCGPLRPLWCFQYESKHKEFKIYAHAITSRKNICLTLAKKFQLKFAHFLLKPINFDDLHLNDEYLVKDCNYVYLKIILTKLNIQKNQCQIFEKFIYNGSTYEKNLYIAQFDHDYEFFLIHCGVKTINNMYIFGQKICNSYYDPHYIAYYLDDKDLGEFQLVEIRKIIGPPLTISKTALGAKLIKIKSYFQG